MTKYMVIAEGQFVIHCKDTSQKHESYRLTQYDFEDVGYTRYFNFETAKLLAKLFKGKIASVAEATVKADLQNKIAAPITTPINASPEPLQLFPNELFKRLRENHASGNKGPDITDSLMPAVQEAILTSMTRQQHSSLTATRKFICKDCL